MIKAILFDMDGVLYDSMHSHAQAWYETMRDINIAASPQDFYMFEGRTGASTINILFNRSFGRDATIEEQKAIYTKKTQRFTELESPGSQPMIGALAVLNKIQILGLQRIIVTGSGQYSLFEKLDKHFPSFFTKDLMVTAYDVQYGKPHPEPYLMGLKKGNLKPDEAIVIENAPLGIESGRAAGIYTIAVNTGILPNDILWRSGANILYSSMYELAENIEELISSLN